MSTSLSLVNNSISKLSVLGTISSLLNIGAAYCELAKNKEISVST